MHRKLTGDYIERIEPFANDGLEETLLVRRRYSRIARRQQSRHVTLEQRHTLGITAGLSQFPLHLVQNLQTSFVVIYPDHGPDFGVSPAVVVTSLPYAQFQQRRRMTTLIEHAGDFRCNVVQILFDETVVVTLGLIIDGNKSVIVCRILEQFGIEQPSVVPAKVLHAIHAEKENRRYPFPLGTMCTTIWLGSSPVGSVFRLRKTLMNLGVTTLSALQVRYDFSCCVRPSLL